jgi:UDP-N-acetylmuramoyl-tripeptide--D-alanyl-D-alanine ligase
VKNIIISIFKRELAYFARMIIARFRPYIIGITGSSGKTTVKYMFGEIAKTIEPDISVSSGNMNTDFGLPLAILGYPKSPVSSFGWIGVFFTVPFKALFRKTYPKYQVLEYAADKPGDIDYLVSIARPDVAIITNVGVAHFGAFKNIERIKKEKWALALAAKDMVICHADVAKLSKSISHPNAKIFTPEESKVSITNIRFLSNKTEFTLEINHKKYDSEFAFIGQHHLDNLALVILAASKVFANDRRVVEAIKNLQPLSGRGHRFVGKNGILVIDESYNANPLSTAAALKILNHTKLGRKVAILGEMKEIGEIGAASHREIASMAKNYANLTIGVGEGYKGTNLEQLDQDIDSLLKTGDVVLVKGSLANNLGKIVDKLR